MSASNNYKIKYAKVGAMIIGIPFLAWSAFIVLYVYFSNDVSLGSVVSFGVGLPAVVLGFPWAILGIFTMAELPTSITESIFSMPINIIGCALIVISPVINGAIIGYHFGKERERRERKAYET